MPLKLVSSIDVRERFRQRYWLPGSAVCASCSLHEPSAGGDGAAPLRVLPRQLLRGRPRHARARGQIPVHLRPRGGVRPAGEGGPPLPRPLLRPVVPRPR